MVYPVPERAPPASFALMHHRADSDQRHLTILGLNPSFSSKTTEAKQIAWQGIKKILSPIQTRRHLPLLLSPSFFIWFTLSDIIIISCPCPLQPVYLVDQMGDSLVVCLGCLSSCLGYLLLGVSSPDWGGDWPLYLSSVLQLNSVTTVAIR